MPPSNQAWRRGCSPSIVPPVCPKLLRKCRVTVSQVVPLTIAVRCVHVVPYLPALRRLRLLRALTQSELAQHARISPTTLSDLETGKTQARPSTMRKLAQALECE